MKRTSLLASVVLAILFVFGTWSTGCGTPTTGESTTEQTTGNEQGTQETAAEPSQGDAAPEEQTPQQEVTPDTVNTPEEVTPEPTPSENNGNEPVQPEQAPEQSNEQVAEQVAEHTPEQGPSKKNLLFVLHSNFSKGAYSVFDLGQKKFLKSQEALASGDVVALHSKHATKDSIIILNRFNSPTKDGLVQMFSTSTWNKDAEVKVGKSANPHDFSGNVVDKAYITLYNTSKLAVLNPQKKELKFIELKSLAEKSQKACKEDKDCKGSKRCNTSSNLCTSDGFPEMSKMLWHKDTLYVLIQGLDRNDGYKAVKSVIAVIDTKTDTLTKTLPLAVNNPLGFIPRPDGTYYVIEAGSTFSSKDGGLEIFDPAKGTLSGKLDVKEADLGGALPYNGAVAIVDNNLGYIILTDPSYKNDLVQFNPSTGQKIKTLIKGSKLGGMVLDRKNGILYVADGKTPSLLSLDAKTGAQKAQQKFTGLPPTTLILLQD